jgi:hypothetical protein
MHLDQHVHAEAEGAAGRDGSGDSPPF